MNGTKRTSMAVLIVVAASLAAAPVGRTGQTQCYKAADANGSEWVEDVGCAANAPANQDGRVRKGVAWPNPRFRKNGNGTVTDELTGLVWLANANCFGQQSWKDAMSSANGLASGSCGLTDGSAAGSWRLPNRFELESLLDLDYVNPALSNGAGTGQWMPGDPFTNVAMTYYWTSSGYVDKPGFAWVVSLGDGVVYANPRPGTLFAWPVRGGK